MLKTEDYRLAVQSLSAKGGDISELQAAVRSTGLHANFRRLHILICFNIV